MATTTKSLREGNHNIQVSLAGYDTLNATINVTADGVLCVSVVDGACGGSGLPRIEVSGANVTPRTVTVYLKEATGTSAKCTWISTQDTTKVAFIADMVLAYNGLKDIGFTPTAKEISDGVLMYSNLGTPATLWGC